MVKPNFAAWLRARTKEGEGCCQIWQQATSGRGYPMACWQGKVRNVRAIAWEQKHGPLPARRQIVMKCSNRLCCNWEHMELKSHRDVQTQCVDREHLRLRFAACPKRRDTAPARKIDMETAREIRRLLMVGGVTQKEVAAQYGLNHNAVSRIWTGKAWREQEAIGSVFAWRPAA